MGLLTKLDVEYEALKNRLVLLYQELALLGKYFQLKIKVDIAQLQSELEQFDSNWVQYNPRKQGFGRYGLSLTSLDGGVSGVPDLDSIFDYKSDHGVNYKESDFSTTTPHLEKLKSIKPLFDVFSGHLGRCHLIKLKKGGFFPPHRDLVTENGDCFRILVLAQNCEPNEFAFVLENKILSLEQGRAYFIQTTLNHAVFSYVEDAIFLVMNIQLSEKSLDIVRSLLKQY